MFLQSRKKSAILKKTNILTLTPMQPEQIPVIRELKLLPQWLWNSFPLSLWPVDSSVLFFYKAAKKQKLLGETFCPFLFFTVFVLKLFVIFILERII